MRFILLTVAFASLGGCVPPQRSATPETSLGAVRADAVLIPSGTFLMGSPAGSPDRDGDEGPQTELHIDSFFADITPVTVTAFEREMGHIHTAAGQPGWWVEADTPSTWLGKCNLGSTRKNHPVNCVTWAAARQYCKLVGGDLPNEAQWEFIARAGSSAPYPWGSNFTTEHAVSSVPCASRGCLGATASVTTSGARCNKWGICDAIGNVWEWTLTDYAETLGPYVHEAATQSPKRPVHRGGAWLDNEPGLFRAAHRGLNYPEHGLTGVGFRCIYQRRG